jgi:hypothetical protein
MFFTPRARVVDDNGLVASHSSDLALSMNFSMNESFSFIQFA